MIALMSAPAILPRPPAESPYLAALNEAQRRAVETLEGPQLVLAGAGTGKTRVLTARLAHILATGRALPSEVLAVTFTNKAAREMRERLEAMIGRSADGLWLGTFHAMAARILRRHAEAVRLKSSFTILDPDDQIRLLKQILAAENIDERRWPARALLALIERWKDRGLDPERVPAGEAAGFADGRALALYRQYQERLLTVNAVDFGDLLLHNLSLFTGNPDILAEYQRRFRYLLVDEYQDTNVAQYLWLRLLAQRHKNLCVVGDDDQSIYSWRGAEISNILRFESDFPGAAITRLEENYRSTSHILGAAAGMIAHNRGRLGKSLWTHAADGDKVVVCGLWDAEEEARWVGGMIEALERENHKLSGIAVLVRAGFQMREFEERFLAIALPYRVLGGPRFYERQEIRDALAYLRLIHQPADDLAFERILNAARHWQRQPAAIACAGARRAPAARRGGPAVDRRRPAPGSRAQRACRFHRHARPLAQPGREHPAHRAGANRARRIRLYRDVAGRALGRRARTARKSQRADRRHGRVRKPCRLSRTCEPRHGQCRRGRWRGGHIDDPAQRQRARIRHGLPARLGGGAVPEPAGDGRERPERARGGASARLCRADPRPPPRLYFVCRQPAHPRPMAERHALALHRRAARRARRARRRARIAGGHGREPVRGRGRGVRGGARRPGLARLAASLGRPGTAAAARGHPAAAPERGGEREGRLCRRRAGVPSQARLRRGHRGRKRHAVDPF